MATQDRANWARYAIVRNPNVERKNTWAPDLPWALYDIVDNEAHHERVLAYGVRYRAALEIVGALNLQEEMIRLHARQKEPAET